MLHVDAVAENKWYGFDVIYYEYGSLVLLYSNPDTAIRVYNILTKANFDDKQLMVLLLPNIQVTVEPFSSFLLLLRFKALFQTLLGSFYTLLRPSICFGRGVPGGVNFLQMHVGRDNVLPSLPLTPLHHQHIKHNRHSPLFPRMSTPPRCLFGTIWLICYSRR